MKFEIDDKTGMIKWITIPLSSNGQEEYTSLGLLEPAKDLEQILQAVKKTQTKLVNKQIQEIQDSKNNE